MTELIEIDGSQGEGGGQILRTALALSIVSGRPFRIHSIRGRRSKPGLLRQHLTGVRAAAEISGARINGAELRSMELTFDPGPVRPGSYRFAVGTAGSANLVLQAILPPLMVASADSELVLEGGTHNDKAPPSDFISKVFAPLLAKMGVELDVTLDRRGFYPAGGGKMIVRVKPATKLAPIELLDGGSVLNKRATAIVAHLPRKIGVRELDVVKKKLGWTDAECEVEEDRTSPGPGNVLMLEVAREHVTELVTGFGAKRVPAEKVADGAVDEMRRYLASRVPVGEHLADQLLIPLALAGGGAFRTGPLTEHSQTNIDVVKRFVDVDISVEHTSRADATVRVRKLD